jgi:hypothetical protein
LPLTDVPAASFASMTRRWLSMASPILPNFLPELPLRSKKPRCKRAGAVIRIVELMLTILNVNLGVYVASNIVDSRFI